MNAKAGSRARCWWEMLDSIIKTYIPSKRNMYLLLLKEVKPKLEKKHQQTGQYEIEVNRK